MNCGKCNAPIVPNRNDRPPGFRRHHGRGLCESCYHIEKKAKNLDAWSYSPRGHNGGECAVCEDIAWMAETGSPVWEWHQRLDTTPRALSRLLRRHGQPQYAAAVDRVVKAG